MPSAAIKFTQGLTSSTAGQALIGVLSTAVVAANGNDGGVANWKWVLLYAPPGSALVSGTLLSDGPIPTVTFTPDVVGGYVLDLTTTDSAGVSAKDRRVFQVPEVSGRIVPPFGADVGSMNPGGSVLGWDPYAQQILRLVESVKSIVNASGGSLAAVATDNGTQTISCVQFTGGPTVLGLAGGYDGRILFVTAPGAGLVIVNQAGGEGVAANRILTGSGNNVVIPADGVALLIYDATASRWRVSGQWLGHFTDDNTFLNATLPIYFHDQATPGIPGAGGALYSTGGYPFWIDEAGNVHQLADFSKVLSADYTNGTDGVTATNLTFPIGANETWFIEFTGTVQCSSTGGSKVQITAPAGTTVEGGYNSSLNAVNTPSNQRITAPNTPTSTATHTVANSPTTDRVWARVTTTGTAGSITIAFASVTNGQTTTVKAGSYLRARLAANV